MERKRILWLCSWYPTELQPFNGDFIQRHAQAAALYNDVYVLHVSGDTTGAINKKTEQINAENGLTEHRILFRKKSTAIGKLVSHYRWLAYCKEAVRKYIHQYGKPDMVHVHIPMRMGMIGIWMKREFGIPFIVTEHWGIYNDVEKQNFNSRGDLFKKYTRAIFEQAEKFISVSRFLADGVNRLVVKRSYEVIPNVVNEKFFFYESPVSGNNFRFIHVSNMVPLKNVEGILEAFDKFSEADPQPVSELKLAGDTDISIRESAKKIVKHGAYSFKGEIPYHKVADAMKGADCLILFSNIENSPCVIGEALCCGIPVIATRVGGIPELVDETNSMLVEPGNIAMLVAAMSHMKNNRMQ
jgi:glycosyltransferase involved in cell wall biosynthesis